MAVCLLVNAFFVSIEFALVGVRHSRIQELIEDGNKRALLVRRLKVDMDASVSGAQLGITLASLGLGWAGEPVIHSALQSLIQTFPLIEELAASHGAAYALGFVAITILHVVLGEQVPKCVALRMSERIVLAMAGPFYIYSRITFPLIWIMDGLSGLILKAFGLRRSHEPPVHSSDELKILFQESLEADEIDDREADLLLNVLEMSDLTVDTMMVPLNEIDAISCDVKFDRLVAIVKRSRRSKLPVYREDPANVIGILHCKDLFEILDLAMDILPPNQVLDFLQKRFKVSALMRTAFRVPYDASAAQVLDCLRQRKVHLAVVVDGKSAIGLVTLEDLLEHLVGEIEER